MCSLIPLKHAIGCSLTALGTVTRSGLGRGSKGTFFDCPASPPWCTARNPNFDSVFHFGGIENLLAAAVDLSHKVPAIMTQPNHYRDSPTSAKRLAQAATIRSLEEARRDGRGFRYTRTARTDGIETCSVLIEPERASCAPKAHTAKVAALPKLMRHARQAAIGVAVSHDDTFANRYLDLQGRTFHELQARPLSAHLGGALR